MKMLNFIFSKIIVFWLFLLITQTTILAQETLFEEVNPNEISLTQEAQKQLVSLPKSETSGTVRILKLNQEILTEEADILQLFKEKSSLAKHTKTIHRADQNFTWFGEFANGSGVFMTVMDGKIAAKFYLGNTPCLLNPLGDSGYYVLTEFTHEVANSNSCGNDHTVFSEPSKAKANSTTSKQMIQESDDLSCNARVLVVVTDDATDWINNLGMEVHQFVQMAIDESNLAYQQSLTDFQIELARTIRTDYQEANTRVDGGTSGLTTDLFNLRNAVGEFDIIPNRRNRYQADFVVLLRRPFGGLYGQAFEVAFGNNDPNPDNAYCFVSTTGVTTGRFSFVHELAHLQGCHHDNVSWSPVYARGAVIAGVPDGIRTIMATNRETSCGPTDGCRIQYFSNPDVSILGLAPIGNSTRNNARRIRETRSVILNHRETPDDLTITHEAVPDQLNANFLANNQLSIQNSIIRDGGSATFRAGNRIRFLPGTRIRAGARVRAYIVSNACAPLPVTVQGIQSNSLSSETYANNAVTLSVFPNPNEGEFTIDLNLLEMPSRNVNELQIYNPFGKVVFSKVVEGSQKIKINLKQFPAGIYLAKLQTASGEIITERILYR